MSLSRFFGGGSNPPQNNGQTTSAPGTMKETGTKKKQTRVTAEELQAAMETAARQQSLTVTVPCPDQATKDGVDALISDLRANTLEYKRISMDREMLGERAKNTIHSIFKLCSIGEDVWEEENTARLEVLIQELQEAKDEVYDAHTKCLQARRHTVINEEQYLKEDKWWLEYRDRFRAAKAQAEATLKAVQEQASEASSEAGATGPTQATAAVPDPTLALLLQQLVTNNGQIAAATTLSAQAAERPLIKVPKFKGEEGEDFLTFRQLFKAAYENKGFAEKTLFSSLMGLLQGDAAATVAGLSCHQGALDQAWELLEEKFATQPILLRQIATKVANLPSNPHEGQLKTIRKTYDVLAMCQRQYVTMGVDGGHTAIATWEKKFPLAFRKSWAEKTIVGNGNPTSNNKDRKHQ